MIIIIEGIDRAGKSTLAQKLAERINGVVIHINKDLQPILQQIKEYDIKTPDFFEDLIVVDVLNQIKSDKHIILDRSIVSADIYRKIRNEKVINCEIILWWMEKIGYDSIYVWLNAEIDFVRTIMHNMKEFPRYANHQYVLMKLLFENYYSKFSQNGMRCIEINRNIECYFDKQGWINELIQKEIDEIIKFMG